jgi:hypothetical protein
MIVLKKMWSVLAIALALALALGLGAGCKLDTSPENDDVYSYNVDELAAGLFGSLSPTMTVNDWVFRVSYPSQTYDQWVQKGIFIYQDQSLKTPFSGSDILDENTVIYCDFSLNGQDKKIGVITGTITLDNIPNPATTKVYIHNSGQYQWLIGKVNINKTDPGGTLNWSIPLYEKYFKPGLQTGLTLSVLSGDSLKTYTVPVSTQITVSGANANVGDLGRVNIRGVTLSGTINVTYNGQPVPYVEIYANYAVQGTLGITCLSSPGPEAPWSVTFGVDSNLNKEMTFQVWGYPEKNGNFLFESYVTVDPTVWVVNNQSKSGIVLDVGDRQY